VSLTRSSYESGKTPLLDLLDSQRSLLTIQRVIANMRVEREKNLVDLEAITAKNLTS
jgi:outer membrane protein TolC